MLRGALCRIDDANMSNLILTVTALCSNLEHLHLTQLLEADLLLLHFPTLLNT